MGFDFCFNPFKPSLNTPCKAVSRHTAKAMIETTKATLTICLYLPLLSSPKLLKFKAFLKLITLKTEPVGEEHQSYLVQNSC